MLGYSGAAKAMHVLEELVPPRWLAFDGYSQDGALFVILAKMIDKLI